MLDVGLLFSHTIHGADIWVFPKVRVPQKGWFRMENPIKMDDLRVPLCSETSIYLHRFMLLNFYGRSQRFHVSCYIHLH